VEAYGECSEEETKEDPQAQVSQTQKALTTQEQVIKQSGVQLCTQ
jgi:hypothetical protein